MSIYASSYISGLNKPVEAWLKEIYGNKVNIIENFDGLIVYETNQPFISAPFFNNSFLCLTTPDNTREYNLVDALPCFIRTLNIDYIELNKHISSKFKTFKILAFNKNQPAKINYKDLSVLESQIAKHTKLKLSKDKHDAEFHIINRSEGVCLLLYKLTYNRTTEKILQKGSLRPELAFALAKLANIKPTDIVIDMFCGSGSIAKAIVKHFKYNMCFASDINEEKIKLLKQEFKNNKKNLFIKQRDASNLSYFQNEFIDKIITDPPWNIFENNGKSFVDNYVNYLKEMERILKTNGTATILMGNIHEFEKALDCIPSLKLKDKFNILVNGKKANIYVLNKQKEQV